MEIMDLPNNNITKQNIISTIMRKVTLQVFEEGKIV